MATHAVGDAAIDLVLDAYEAANRERSIAGRRWTIEHAFIGRPDHLPRMKALDVAISAQNHLYLAGPSLVKYWGAARAALTTPVRRYLDAGLLVSSGTDAAVVPYPPLWTIYHFITRDTLTGGVMGADQRITRAGSAAAGDDQQRAPDVRREAERIDRSRQARRPRRALREHPHRARKRASAMRKS